METPVFSDESVRPDDLRLAEALGKSGPRWEEIRAFVRARFGEAAEEWKYYGRNQGGP